MLLLTTQETQSVLPSPFPKCTETHNSNYMAFSGWSKASCELSKGDCTEAQHILSRTTFLCSNLGAQMQTCDLPYLYLGRLPDKMIEVLTLATSHKKKFKCIVLKY